MNFLSYLALGSTLILISFSQKFSTSEAKSITNGALLSKICFYHKLAGQDCIDYLLKKGQFENFRSLQEDDNEDYDGAKSSKMAANLARNAADVGAVFDYSNDDGYLTEALRDKKVRFGKRVVPKPRMG